LGKVYEIKVWCYWEHPWETQLKLEEHHWKHLVTHKEHGGNTKQKGSILTSPSLFLEWKRIHYLASKLPLTIDSYVISLSKYILRNNKGCSYLYFSPCA
jgi:hypothetical protein